MTRQVIAGITDQTIGFQAYEADGTPIQLAHDSPGMAVYYRVDANGRRGTRVALTPLVTRTAAGVHTDKSVTNMSSSEYHEVDLPDVCFATAGTRVVVEVEATALVAGTVTTVDPIEVIAGGSQAVTLQLGATIPLTLGQVTGLTQDLVVGNSYTEELGTRIPVTLTDASGDAIDTVFGSRSLSDADCTIKCVLHPINARNTDNVTAAAQGICEFVPASGATPASRWIELPITETSRLTPGVYSIQFHAVWDDGELVSLAWKGTCKFVRIIRPKS